MAKTKTAREPRKTREPKKASVSTREIFFTERDLKNVNLKPRQQEFHEKIVENYITFCVGPAGTSKTFTGCYAALKMLASGEIKKIILSKPLVESGEKLGYLPGDIDEKIAPYIESFKHNFEQIIGKQLTEFLFESGAIEFKPLAYLRGTGFSNSFLWLDEAQNADYRQLMLFITRMGKNTKVLVSGDASQNDIDEKLVGILLFWEKIMKGIKGTDIFKFERKDIVRHPILIEITDKYEKWKEQENPKKKML